MTSLGSLNAQFDVTTRGVEVTYDPCLRQQFLAFNFMLKVPISHLLQELLQFQHRTSSDRDTPLASGLSSAAGAEDPDQRQQLAMPGRQNNNQQQNSSASDFDFFQRRALARPQIERVSGMMQSRGSGISTGTAESGRNHAAAQPGAAAAQALAAPATRPPSSAVSAQSRRAAPEAAAAKQQPAARAAAPEQRGTMQPHRPAEQAAPAQHDSNASREALARASAASEELLEALRRGRAADVRRLLRQGANVAMPIPGRDSGSYLRAALDVHKHLSTGVESPQTLELVSILVQAKSNVNSGGDDGRTPLHMAIQQHELMSPLVARLLVSSRADLNARDLSQMSPVAYLRAQADPQSCAVRQLMEEVTTQPTVAVGVVEDEQVLGACFADMENGKVGFFTPTSVGLFDVTQRQIIAKMKLTQKRVQSTVRGMTINPEMGTIAVFLEVANAKSTDTNVVPSLIMVWPSGQLQDGEEPLKLSVDGGRAVGSSSQMHPTILGSTSAAPVTLLSRIYSGQVYCWRLQAACAQIVSQRLITESGGLLALSACGTWFAAVNLAEQGKPNLEVWTFTGKVPEKVTTLDKRPQTMSIIGLNDGSGCAHVAMAEEAALGQPPVPVEVLRIEASGATSSVSVVQMESPCRMLSFLQSGDRILSGHGDGAVVVTNYSTSESSTAHDDHSMRTASASPDQSMIVTAVGNTVRVFRMGELQAGHSPHAARDH